MAQLGADARQRLRSCQALLGSIAQQVYEFISTWLAKMEIASLLL